MNVSPENRTQMTQKKLIFADKKDGSFGALGVNGRADCESALRSNALEPDSQSGGVNLLKSC